LFNFYLPKYQKTRYLNNLSLAKSKAIILTNGYGIFVLSIDTNIVENYDKMICLNYV